MKTNPKNHRLRIYGLNWILTLLPVCGYSQPTITEDDIEIRTQLTLIKVADKSIDDFNSSLAEIASLAKKIQLSENYDWLTYDAGKNQFLIVNSSTSLADVLSPADYKQVLLNSEEGLSFQKPIQAFGNCDIRVKDNLVQEMILPCSTVKEIFVSQHPLTTFSEFEIKPSAFAQFDIIVRTMVKLLKEVNYPYPLESNRGSVGAYGSVFLVWFYDDNMSIDIYDHIASWMNDAGRQTEWKASMQQLAELTLSRQDMKFKFIKELSY